MRFLPLAVCSAALLTLGSACVPLRAQTFAAIAGTDPVIGGVPATGSSSRVSVPGHNRRAEESLLFGRVRDGIYTVDGMVAKVQLNYDVDAARFLYFFVPGVGTAVVSVTADPSTVVTEASLKDNELSFAVGDHRFKLTGVALASNRGTVPAHLFVKLDRSAWQLSRHAMVGFGTAPATPYAWPGALPHAAAPVQAEEASIVPPVPASLLPSTSPVRPAMPPASVDPAALGSVALK